MKTVLRHVRKLIAIENCRDIADAELLRRFREQRDEAAFAALVERHGPMVLAAARRVLHNDHDAEDVLQATYLLLTRKADAIRRTASVGSWLYGVAYRLALKLRAQTMRQRQQERRALDAAPPRDGSEITLQESQSLLDDELQKLPEKYRLPILLCCLEGKSRDEAARQLGWPIGAVKIRLERGRDLLKQRLRRRGVCLSAMLLSNFLAPGQASALPLRLSAATVEACLKFAAGETVPSISPTALSLADGMLRTLAAGKLKTIVAIAAAIGMLGLALAFALALAIHFMPQHLPAGESQRAILQDPPLEKKILTETATPVQQPALTSTPGRTVRGTLAAIDLNQEIITVRRGEEGNQSFNTAQARVLIDGREASLTELKTSWRISVETNSDETSALEIQVEGPILKGVVDRVDSKQGTITLRHGDLANQTSTFTVAAPVRGELSQLVVGTNITVHLTVDRKSVVRISPTAK